MKQSRSSDFFSDYYACLIQPNSLVFAQIYFVRIHLVAIIDLIFPWYTSETEDLSGKSVSLGQGWRTALAKQPLEHNNKNFHRKFWLLFSGGWFARWGLPLLLFGG
jgi:hypothetical protein